MKIVVSVVTTARMGAGANNIGFPFEVEAYSIEHLLDRLRADGAVIGDKLKLRLVEPGVRVVEERQQTILTLYGAALIQEQHGRVIEYDPAGDAEPA